MAIAHVTTEQYLLIGEAFTKWVTANKRQPAHGDWPAILGDALFLAAVEGGYFGPVGLIPGFPYPKDAVVKGAQVTATTEEGRGIVYRLIVDGKVVAEETGGGDFDTVAFAKRHGQTI